MRSSSLLDTNHRLRRTSARTRLLETALLKRRSSCSGVSFDLASTLGNLLTSLFSKITGQAVYPHILMDKSVSSVLPDFVMLLRPMLKNNQVSLGMIPHWL
jgi:uncharacterized protein (DUF2342 family)